MQMAPKVSIGLPVYNGENYLVKAIDSILAQTFTDFELIITDNASTDSTEALCRQYAAADKRIRYIRNPVNLGAAPNFNKAFELATGKYFKWAAHDDILAPDFLERCVGILDRKPEVVLCYTGTCVIDDAGDVLQEYRYLGHVTAPDTQRRFAAMLLSSDMCYEIFGLIRRDILAKTSLIGNYGHGDGVLLARLALEGPYFEVPDKLLYVRKHVQQSMSTNKGTDQYGRPDYHAYANWFDTNKKRKIILPNWKILAEFTKAVWQARLSPLEGIYCHFHLVRWVKRHIHYLTGDLRIAAKQQLKRST